MKKQSNLLLAFLLLIAITSLAQISKTRNYAIVTDSLFKKHCKKNSIHFSIKTDLAVTNFFFYKKGKKWRGLAFDDVSLLMPTGQFSHRVRIKSFNADTVGPKLVALGIDSLKQYSQKELTDFYSKKKNEKEMTIKEYPLPPCADGGLVSITVKGKTTAYSDCICATLELKALPEIRRFTDIFTYLQGTVYQIVNKRKE